MKYTNIVVLLLLSASFAFGQAGIYRSRASGPWGTAATWDRDADSNGSFEESPSTVPPNTNTTAGIITIRNGHVVNVAASVTADQITIQSGGELVVDATFTLTLGNAVGAEVTVNSGGDLTVNGIINYGGSLPLRTISITGDLNNNGTHTGATSTKLFFQSGGNYYHLFTDGGTIPLASWNANSTMNVTGIGSGAVTIPTNLGQTFGNFAWNTPSFDGFFDLAGSPSSISGDFRIEDTGIGVLVYNFSGAGNATFSIAGDLSVSGGIFGFTALLGIPGTLNINTSLTAGKGLKITGGFLQIADDDNVTVNCNGLLSLAVGDLELAATTATTTLNVSGDFTHTSGSLNSTSGTNAINFNGTSLQTYTSSITPGGNLNYNIPVNAILFISGNNYVSGGGTFTVSGTLRVGSTNANGAMQTGTSNGNIRVSGTRTYNSASTIVYAGSAGQFIGNGHPTTSGVNTTIDNASGVSLIVGTPIIITTNLTLTSGNLNIGNGTLTLNGNLVANANNITIGSGGSISIGGTGSIGTFPFPSGAQTFTNFTLDNSNGVTIANSATISGVVTLTSGSLSFPGQTLTLNGTFAGTGSGDLSTSSTSTLVIGGSGAFGALRMNTDAPANHTLGIFTFNRSSSGSGSLSTALIVNTTFNLTNGNFTNSGGLQMANGSTLIRNSNSQLLTTGPSNLPVGENYNVTYSGSTLTTGLELPTTSDDMLRNLTINGGPVTLGQNIIVRGDVTLQNSTLQAGTRSITLSAASGIWSRGSGSFDPGTGTVTVVGNITVSGSSTPNFGNLSVSSGSTITMPAGNITITGNLQINSASTYNSSNGTIVLGSGSSQSISGGAKTFRNITVNKTGGTVTISNAVSLTGLLDIQSATTVSSGGNLTLISNVSGTASIGDLSGGGSVTGDVIVQRYIAGTGRDFRDISAPVQNPTVAQIIASGITITGSFTGTSFPCSGCTTNNPSFYFYTESVAGAQANGYTAHPPNGGNSTTSTLSPGRGYNLLVRNEVGSPTVSLTGSINSGAQVLPVSYTTTSGGSSEDGWNFIGNPYPSSIDWDIIPGWTKTAIQGNQISVWDPQKGGSGGYRVWNGSAGDLGNGRIAAGQGFWIKASATPTLNISEEAKSTTATSFYRTKETESTTSLLELVLKGEGVEDQTYIQLKESATLSLDQFDGPKLSAIEGVSLSTVTDENYRLSINAIGEIPERKGFLLRLSNMEEGTYTFSKNTVGEFNSCYISLLDKRTGDLHDFSSGIDYVFTVTEMEDSKADNRFMLIVSKEKIDNQSPISVAVYPNPVLNEMKVSVGSLSSPIGVIMDSMGKSLGEVSWERDEINNKQWSGRFDMSSESTGFYFVRINTSDGSHVVKFLKK